jgi:MbtH protein
MASHQDATTIWDDPDVRFKVVVNDEDQYSIWPASKPTPDGWREVLVDTKAACLDHIEQVWLDLRPRSVRVAMDAAAVRRGIRP